MCYLFVHPWTPSNKQLLNIIPSPSCKRYLLYTSHPLTFFFSKTCSLAYTVVLWYGYNHGSGFTLAEKAEWWRQINSQLISMDYVPDVVHRGPLPWPCWRPLESDSTRMIRFESSPSLTLLDSKFISKWRV